MTQIRIFYTSTIIIGADFFYITVFFKKQMRNSLLYKWYSLLQSYLEISTQIGPIMEI